MYDLRWKYGNAVAVILEIMAMAHWKMEDDRIALCISTQAKKYWKCSLFVLVCIFFLFFSPIPCSFWMTEFVSCIQWACWTIEKKKGSCTCSKKHVVEYQSFEPHSYNLISKTEKSHKNIEAPDTCTNRHDE